MPIFQTYRLILGAAIASLTFLSGCGTPPDRIILLPDPDGKVGAVIIHSATHEQLVNKAYAGVDVASDGEIENTTNSQASVQKRYGGLLAARPPRPMNFTIHFLFDSATKLAPESSSTVNKIKAVLAKWPAPHIFVVGHTDSAGSQELNDKLSLERARSVAAFMIREGVPARDIEAVGRGKREPLVPTVDGVPNPINRRVVITIQ